MQIVLRFELPGEVVDRIAQPRAFESRPAFRARSVRDPADGEAYLVVAYHRRGGDDGKVAVPLGKFRERVTDSLAAQGIAHFLDQLVGSARREQHALEEFLRPQRTSLRARAEHHLPLQREQGEWQFRARVRMCDRPAYRPAVADLKVCDVRKRLPQQGHFIAEPGAPFDARLGGGRADGERTVGDARIGELRRTRNVDEHPGLGQSHVEHRHERLPAGENSRILAGLGQHFERLVGAVGAHVIERGGLHRRTPRRRRSRRHQLSCAIGAPPAACRTSCSNNCRSTIFAAPSSMRPPTAATLPETSAS